MSDPYLGDGGGDIDSEDKGMADIEREDEKILSETTKNKLKTKGCVRVVEDQKLEHAQ